MYLKVIGIKSVQFLNLRLHIKILNGVHKEILKYYKEKSKKFVIYFYS